MKTIEELEKLMADGKFHHATYRDIGTVWEGLMVYEKEANGFNGFKPWGLFPKGPMADNAHIIVRHTGVSVGSFGKG